MTLPSMTAAEWLKYIAELGACPGVTVNECRRAFGLDDHPDHSIGEMTLNLPGEILGYGRPLLPANQVTQNFA